MVKTYVGTRYCEKCDKYFMPSFSRMTRQFDPCPECDGSTKHKSVIKGSKDDPRTYTEYVNIAEREHERYSMSLGVSDNQIEEARKLHPQAEWKKFGNSWRPKIRNRTEKLKLMKQAGYEEFPVNYFNQKEGK